MSIENKWGFRDYLACAVMVIVFLFAAFILISAFFSVHTRSVAEEVCYTHNYTDVRWTSDGKIWCIKHINQTDVMVPARDLK